MLHLPGSERFRFRPLGVHCNITLTRLTVVLAVLVLRLSEVQDCCFWASSFAHISFGGVHGVRGMYVAVVSFFV